MATMTNSRIVGLGRHVPANVVTNEDLTTRMDTTDEWIQQRTGIRERHYIAEKAGAADLGAVAAREALELSGIAAGDVALARREMHAGRSPRKKGAS